MVLENIEVSFSDLVLGFSSAALHYLGEQRQTNQEQRQNNLHLARHNIEILQLLEEKTKGNLEDEERSLLRNVISDLHIKYAAAVKPSSTEGSNTSAKNS